MASLLGRQTRREVISGLESLARDAERPVDGRAITCIVIDLPERKRDREELAKDLREIGAKLADVQRTSGSVPWPIAISDGLTLPCHDCGEVPRFDYNVKHEFWAQWVPDPSERTGVVCLPCLDRRCAGVGLAEAIRFIQWTGTWHTVELVPSRIHTYSEHPRGDGGKEAARTGMGNK
jgi:hypothetical protein